MKPLRRMSIVSAFACLCGMALMVTGRAAAEPKAAAAVGDAGAAATVEAQVEGLLFFATNEDAAAPAAEAQAVEKEMDAGTLRDLRERLAKAYQFTRFHLLGRHTQKVFKEYESWVVPSKELCLKIDSRGPAEGGGINLHLQLWQEKKVLVKSDVTLKPGQPIFLGGPPWRKGRLLFVLRKL
ncbi:MAG: hypothetical protein KA004_15965 [Verrucomicrobiales bacterium]|nr:hypothetical protein [Verrucomicrobiales bacterium]